MPIIKQDLAEAKQEYFQEVLMETGQYLDHDEQEIEEGKGVQEVGEEQIEWMVNFVDVISSQTHEMNISKTTLLCWKIEIILGRALMDAQGSDYELRKCVNMLNEWIETRS